MSATCVIDGCTFEPEWLVVSAPDIVAVCAIHRSLCDEDAPLPLSLKVKLGSIVAHAQEANSPSGTGYDVAALGTLVTDPEVVAWLATIDPVFLPVKR